MIESAASYTVLLETTILALAVSYVGFDLYFLAAALVWSRRLRHVNREALVFSGFRDVLSFVYQGPVPDVAHDLVEHATTTEGAGRLVSEAYPVVRDRLGNTHQRFELPQRLLQLEREARTIRWISVALAAAIVALVVFATVTPFGIKVPYVYEVLIGVVLGNSALSILFATTRAQIELSLRQSEEVLAHAHAASPVGSPSTSPTVLDQR